MRGGRRPLHWHATGRRPRLNRIAPSDCITDGNRRLREAILDGILAVIGLVTTSADVIARL